MARPAGDDSGHRVALDFQWPGQRLVKSLVRLARLGVQDRLGWTAADHRHRVLVAHDP
jgi:hypothetical protein